MSAFAKPAPPACRIDADGMALIGTPRLDMMGLRFHSGDPVNPPSATTPPATTPPATTPPATTSPATTPPATTPPSTTPPTTTPPAAEDPITAPVGDVKFADLPPETQAEVRRLRTLDQQNRAKATEWEAAGISPAMREQLGKALGFVEENPTVEGLTGKVGELTTRASEAEAGLAAANRANMVLLQAPDAGARAASLLDSKGFTESIAGLDPTDATGIRTAIDTWLTSHPEHRASGVIAGTIPPSGVTPRAGGAGSQAKPGLEGAIAGALAQQQPRQ
jgi:hypothetical protein